MFIHLQLYFCNFFFTRRDFNFVWLLFIKLIWWDRARPIFSKFDNASIFAAYFIKFIWFNKFDQINLTLHLWLKTLYLKEYSRDDFLSTESQEVFLLFIEDLKKPELITDIRVLFLGQFFRSIWLLFYVFPSTIITVSFFFQKIKISPMKPLAIPQLELLTYWLPSILYLLKYEVIKSVIPNVNFYNRSHA